MKSLRTVAMGMVAVCLLTACSTTPEKKTAEGTSNEKDYVRYRPTGSHISERMPRKKTVVKDEDRERDQNTVGQMQSLSHMTREMVPDMDPSGPNRPN